LMWRRVTLHFWCGVTLHTGVTLHIRCGEKSLFTLYVERTHFMCRGVTLHIIIMWR
jgi:hypothetical protein